ncbi:MAG: hypothetical protein ACT4OV_07180 [Microthrixaceae bacterium]
MADLAPSVVAAASGLIGAAIGGSVTYGVARQQIRASRDTQEADRRREAVQRRRELYAGFIAAATQVVGSWLGIMGRPIDEATLRAADDDREDHYRELQKLAAMVRISASSEVAAAAEVLLTEVRRTQASVRAALQAGTADVPSAEWDELEAAFADARDRFVEVVRAIRRGD